MGIFYPIAIECRIARPIAVGGGLPRWCSPTPASDNYRGLNAP
jgi:hypothetical protein